MLTGIWAGVRVLSSDLKKEREEAMKGGREGEERETESEPYHTPLSHQGQSFHAISLEHETSFCWLRVHYEPKRSQFPSLASGVPSF